MNAVDVEESYGDWWRIVILRLKVLAKLRATRHASKGARDPLISYSANESFASYAFFRKRGSPPASESLWCTHPFCISCCLKLTEESQINGERCKVWPHGDGHPYPAGDHRKPFAIPTHRHHTTNISLPKYQELIVWCYQHLRGWNGKHFPSEVVNFRTQ